MKKLIRLSHALYAVTLTLTLACSSDHGQMEPDDPTPDPTAVERIDDNLARVQALEVFSVGELVVDEGEPLEVAATELEAFAGRAEAACAAVEADPTACGMAAI